MSGSEFTDGDYPTEHALQMLRDWPLKDMAGALDFAKSIWHWPEAATHDISAHEGHVLHAEPEDRFLRLATGGWSGNEDIIGAMGENVMLHAMTWRLSTRGGLHIFQYPKREDA